MQEQYAVLFFPFKNVNQASPPDALPPSTTLHLDIQTPVLGSINVLHANNKRIQRTQELLFFFFFQTSFLPYNAPPASTLPRLSAA